MKKKPLVSPSESAVEHARVEGHAQAQQFVREQYRETALLQPRRYFITVEALSLRINLILPSSRNTEGPRGMICMARIISEQD